VILEGEFDTIPQWLAERALSMSDDAIYVVDPDLNIIAANETIGKWSKSNGITDTIAGKNILEGLPFINEAAISDIKQVLQTSKPILNEYVWPLEQNKIIVAQIMPLYTPDAKVQAITIARDIGEQKRIIDGIIKQELAARLLLEQATDGIHIYTIEGELIYANEALFTRLGYTLNEFMKLKQVDIDISANEERFPKIRQKMLAKGRLLYETFFITKDGRKINTEVNSNVVQYFGETAILSISRDLTERRIVAEGISDVSELQTVKNNLERSNSDLELYTQLLLHDLRNDLHLVLAQVESSKLEIAPSKKVFKALNVIQMATERMSQMLEMFAFSTRLSEKDIQSCLSFAIADARNLNPNVQIEMNNNAGTESLYVSAGRLLPLVWANLLRNAVKFAGSEAHIRIMISKSENTIIVDIVDDGPGISKEIRHVLFTKGASTTGSGYGLYLCRKIVDAYGGKIELVDKKQKGAHFKVTLLSA
jgi:PAS domain S-box-containing protein